MAQRSTNRSSHRLKVESWSSVSSGLIGLWASRKLGAVHNSRSSRALCTYGVHRSCVQPSRTGSKSDLSGGSTTALKVVVSETVRRHHFQVDLPGEWEAVTAARSRPATAPTGVLRLSPRALCRLDARDDPDTDPRAVLTGGRLVPAKSRCQVACFYNSCVAVSNLGSLFVVSGSPPESS